MDGYIYVLYNPIYKTYGDNVYKIGRAVDIQTRLKSFTKSYIEPTIVKYSLCSKYFIELEKNIHKKLNQYRINPKREYFNCDLELIIKTIEKENEELNMLKCEFLKEEFEQHNIGLKKEYPNSRKLNLLKKQIKEDELVDKFLIDFKEKIENMDKNSFRYKLENTSYINLKETFDIIKRNRNRKIYLFEDILRPFFSNNKGKISVILTDRERLILAGINSEGKKVTLTPEYLLNNIIKKSSLNNPYITLYYKKPISFKEKERQEIKGTDNIKFILDGLYDIVPFKVKDLSLELFKKILRYNRGLFNFKCIEKNSKSDFLDKTQPEIVIKFIED